jgi:NADPH:quinone reductase-like Zn-dependent oxidoreductase
LRLINERLDLGLVEQRGVDAGGGQVMPWFQADHSGPPGPAEQPQGEDMSAVLGLLADGVLTAEVGACFPLAEVSAAMRLAESHTVRGKVVLIP